MSSPGLRAFGFCALFGGLCAPVGAAEPAPADPPLEITLRVDRMRYIHLEPIRLCALARNTDDQKDYYIHFPPGGKAAAVEFWRTRENGPPESLHIVHPRMMTIDGPVPQYWAIAKNWTDEWVHWVRNDVPPGRYTFKVVFKPLAGPHRGRELASETVSVDVAEPAGIDLEARGFMRTRGPDGLTWASPHAMGLIPHRNTQRGRPLQENFLRAHGRSTYSWYVRYNMSQYLLMTSREQSVRLAKEIVDKAPSDFPLLAEGILDLITHYRHQGEAKRVRELLERLRTDRLQFIHPRLEERLRYEIRGLPPAEPKTAGEKWAARDFELTRKAKDIAHAHWLVADLRARYGEPSQLQYDSGFADLIFSDFRQGWPVRTKFHLDEEGRLKKMVFHASLESFRIGRLAPVIDQVKKGFSLDEEKSLKTFLEATLKGDALEMKLTFTDKKEAAVTVDMKTGVLQAVDTAVDARNE